MPGSLLVDTHPDRGVTPQEEEVASLDPFLPQEVGVAWRLQKQTGHDVHKPLTSPPSRERRPTRSNGGKEGASSSGHCPELSAEEASMPDSEVDTQASQARENPP